MLSNERGSSPFADLSNDVIPCIISYSDETTVLNFRLVDKMFFHETLRVVLAKVDEQSFDTKKKLSIGTFLTSKFLTYAFRESVLSHIGYEIPPDILENVRSDNPCFFGIDDRNMYMRTVWQIASPNARLVEDVSIFDLGSHIRNNKALLVPLAKRWCSLNNPLSKKKLFTKAIFALYESNFEVDKVINKLSANTDAVLSFFLIALLRNKKEFSHLSYLAYRLIESNDDYKSQIDMIIQIFSEAKEILHLNHVANRLIESSDDYTQQIQLNIDHFGKLDLFPHYTFLKFILCIFRLLDKNTYALKLRLPFWVLGHVSVLTIESAFLIVLFKVFYPCFVRII